MKEGPKTHHFHQGCPWISSALQQMLSCYPNCTFCCQLLTTVLQAEKLKISAKTAPS